MTLHRFFLAAIALYAALPAPSAEAVASPISGLRAPAELTCDHQTDPLAVASRRPLLGWMLTAMDPGARGVTQGAYRVQVASTLDGLAAGRGDLWDSGRVASSETRNIPYAGAAIAPEQRAYWRIEVWDGQGIASGWSAPASFTMAPARWSAQWIAAAPAGSPEGRAEGVTEPMPVFADSFVIGKPLARALLYVSGLGQYEAQMNGAKAGRREMTPGWTDYRKRILYDAYDVTGLVKQGTNAIGVLLGNGMFNVAETPGRYTKFVGAFGQPQCMVELHLHFRDGTRTVIASGSGWRTMPGPITYSSTYGGEDYDATRTAANWSAAERSNAPAWRPAIVAPGPGGKLAPEVTAPIRVEKVYHPRSRTTLPGGSIVYDLGQNFAGWPAIAVRGMRGAKVRLIPGELLNPDGSVSQRSADGGGKSGQWYTYTLAGAGVERWHPRFSYYGFRYVQAETVGSVQLLRLTGEAVHASAAETGDFTSANPLLNRIHALILRSIENNLESVLTDCPHREKLGWLEETHLMGSALNFDFNLERLYGKIEQDMADAQAPDGGVPTIAPQFTIFGKPSNVFNDSPEWGSAVVLDPWIAYRRYGDLAALREQYPAMQRYVEYLTSRSVNGIVDYGLGDWYDIGPKPPGFAQLTSRALTATAVYYQDIVALRSSAHVLGKADDEARLKKLGDGVARAFQQRLYHPAQRYYDRDSQTADAMPLVLGLVPPPDRAAVLAHLVADIRAHRDHVTAGDVGFHYVVDALLENGASDVLLDMLLRTDSPSYGYQLAQGATSLTEAWDANPRSSQDHFMLGDAEEWFYAGLGGLDLDLAQADDRQIVIHPAMPPRLQSAAISYRSVKGPIAVSWRRQAGSIALDLTIPANAAAIVVLPPCAEAAVREGPRPASQAPGVTFETMQGGSPVFRVVSGSYHFRAPDVAPDVLRTR